MKQSSIVPARDLAFPMHEILNLPQPADIEMATVSGPTTSLTLRGAVPGEPEASYFVKTLKKGTPPGPHLNLGLREVRFYALIDSLSPDPYPNIPRCIKRHIRHDEGNYYLVLEDCSVSHQSYERVDFNSLKPWKTALAALADFHRGFTQKLEADQIHALADDRNKVEQYIQKLIAAFETFKTDHYDIMDDSVLSLMESLIPRIRAFELEKVDRINQNVLTTLLHRDAHLRNFLYPRSAGGRAVIVDWQFWGLGIGVFDLRPLLGSALPPEMRMEQETLVQFYYEAALEGIEADYSWADCWNDYRKGVIDNLFMSVWQYTGFGWEFERWKDTLKSAVENYYAMDCEEITSQYGMGDF